MHRDARAEGMTFVELRLREAFKHAYRVTLTEFHEDVPKRSDCCPTVGKQTPTNRYGVGVRLEGCGCYKRVRKSHGFFNSRSGRAIIAIRQSFQLRQ
jgi:hypothetical protein